MTVYDPPAAGAVCDINGYSMSVPLKDGNIPLV